MELTFLGRGAAFNPKEGNTSAYFIENNRLFLIDCGESVFERIIERGILNNIQDINVMITHTHSDHIGSLGSLIMYSYFVLKRPLNIILPESAKHMSDILNLLNAFGCTKDMYRLLIDKSFDNQYNSFKSIRFIETKHAEEIDSYGIIFNTTNGIVYYSGDTRDINLLRSIAQSNKLIDKIYVDTTTLDYPQNVHMNIHLISSVIPEYLKSKVYCMHLNNDDCIIEAENLGFNVVECKTEEYSLK